MLCGCEHPHLLQVLRRRILYCRSPNDKRSCQGHPDHSKTRPDTLRPRECRTKRAAERGWMRRRCMQRELIRREKKQDSRATISTSTPARQSSDLISSSICGVPCLTRINDRNVRNDPLSLQDPADGMSGQLGRLCYKVRLNCASLPKRVGLGCKVCRWCNSHGTWRRARALGACQ